MAPGPWPLCPLSCFSGTSEIHYLQPPWPHLSPQCLSLWGEGLPSLILGNHAPPRLPHLCPAPPSAHLSIIPPARRWEFVLFLHWCPLTYTRQPLSPDLWVLWDAPPCPGNMSGTCQPLLQQTHTHTHTWKVMDDTCGTSGPRPSASPLWGAREVGLAQTPPRAASTPHLTVQTL